MPYYLFLFLLLLISGNQISGMNGKTEQTDIGGKVTLYEATVFAHGVRKILWLFEYMAFIENRCIETFQKKCLQKAAFEKSGLVDFEIKHKNRLLNNDAYKNFLIDCSQDKLFTIAMRAQEYNFLYLAKEANNLYIERFIIDLKERFPAANS